MSQEIKIALKLTNRLISINDLYRCRTIYQGGKPRAVMYKNPDATKIEQEMFDQLRAIDWTPYMDFLKNTKRFSLLLQFVFIGKPSKRLDSSNYIKSCEDNFTKFIHDVLGIDRYDDCLHAEVHAYKSFIEKGTPGSTNMVFIQLKESNFNLNFNQVGKPDKVFLAEPDDALKKFLKKNKIKVKEKREQANTVIHLVAGPITPVKALELNKIIDEAEGYCYIGITGDEEPEEELLTALEQQTGGRSTIKVEWIGSTFDKILEWLNQ